MTVHEGVKAGSEQDTSSNKIFISYSRQDKAFVMLLDQALRQSGHEPWVDWSDIQPAEDWWQAIERGIDSASIFVFVISPDSIASQVCQRELEYGLQQNKRLVPLLRREGFDLDKPHTAISRHNWIFFRDIDDFDQAFQTLVTALTTDLGYVRTHARLLVRAKEWQHKLLDNSFLLRGSELLEAQQWLDTSHEKDPPPTELHHHYVAVSQQEEQTRQAIELRLRQMSPQEYRNRQTLLKKVNAYWIQEVLENSLQDQVLIELGLEERQDTVTPPWYMSADQTDSTPKPFPEGTGIMTLFDQLGEGRTLLILGEPGAGKTTTLLQLAQDLVDRAEQGLDDRIPVVFNLSSWAGEKQTICEWLVDELSRKYQIPPAIGQTWIEKQQILLLLDGLDEVQAENQDACVLALNIFQQQYGAEVVVCCRVQDYEHLKNRLNFQQAILLRSLTPEQIYRYLESIGGEMEALQTLLKQDMVLQELAQSPLMLNMMALVYQGKTAADLPNLSLEAQRHHLLDAFINKMLPRRGPIKTYTKDQTIHYLTWLAQKMLQSSHSVFLIEEMQPTWLSTPLAQRVYRVIVMGMVGLLCGIIMGLFAKVLNYAISPQVGISIGLTAGVLSGLIVGLLPKLKSNWAFGIMTGLVSGLIFGLVGRLFDSFQPLNISIFGLIIGIVFVRLNEPQIDPADTVQWSWIRGKQKFFVGTAWGLFVGGMLLIARWLLLPPDFNARFCNQALPELLTKWTGSVLVDFICQTETAITPVTVLGLLCLGLFVGSMVSLVLGFQKIAKVESRTIPNHGIWKSARNAATLIAICGSLAAVISLLIWLLYFWFPNPNGDPTQPITSKFIWWIYYGNALPDGLMFSLSVGVLVGLISGLVGGENSGLVTLQHFVLRSMLWKIGHIPWNYARFLNYAADRILLKKVGGGYIFIHRLLLEHFARLH